MAVSGALPERYGNWHTVYMRMMRWSKAGVLDRVFERLQRQRLMRVRIEAVYLAGAWCRWCRPIRSAASHGRTSGGLSPA